MFKTPVYGGLLQSLASDLARFVFDNIQVCHPGLVLERYLPFDFSPGPQPIGENKGPWLRRFAEKGNQAIQAEDAPWRQWSERHKQMVDEWPGACSFHMQPRWRWVVGLGNQTVLETGITLHHTFGVPHIPGSSLKGLTQALVELENPTELDSAAKVQLFGEQSSDISGGEATQAAGRIVFLGAIPAHNADNPRDCPRLVVDVMTPHFPKYYQGERPHPLEVEDPNPIPFLVVAGGTYHVTVAPRRPGKDRELVERARDLCRTALEDMGIGGKTAKGYGYFVKPPEQGEGVQ